MICDMTIFKLDGKNNLTLKIYKKKKNPVELNLAEIGINLIYSNWSF
jgi:hypothetical protein